MAMHVEGWHCNRVVLLDWVRSVKVRIKKQPLNPTVEELMRTVIAQSLKSDCKLCLNNVHLCRRLLHSESDYDPALSVLF